MKLSKPGMKGESSVQEDRKSRDPKLFIQSNPFTPTLQVKYRLGDFSASLRNDRVPGVATLYNFFGTPLNGGYFTFPRFLFIIIPKDFSVRRPIPLCQCMSITARIAGPSLTLYAK